MREAPQTIAQFGSCSSHLWDFAETAKDFGQLIDQYVSRSAIIDGNERPDAE